MDEKELKALWDKISGKIDTSVKDVVKIEFDNATSGLLKTADFENRLKEIGITGEAMKTLTEAAEKQGDKLNEILASQKKDPKSLKQIIVENKDKFEEASERKGLRKILIPIANKTTVTVNSSFTTDPGGYIIPGMEDLPLPAVGIESALTPILLPANHHGTIRYTDLTTHTKNAAMIAEGSSVSDSVMAWTGSSITVEKALATIPVSYESLKDVVEMETVIKRLLTAEIVQVKESQLAEGSGTPPYIYGIYTKATAFDYAAWAGVKTKAANIYDLCMLMKTKINVLYGSKFIPNLVLMNPYDALAAKWVKDELGNYVRNPFVSPDGSMIAGMRIVETPALTAGRLVVGDSRYAQLYLGDSIEIEMGYDGNNFSDDLVMVKARHRMAMLIRSVDAFGFLSVDAIDSALPYITESIG